MNGLILFLFLHFFSASHVSADEDPMAVCMWNCWTPVSQIKFKQDDPEADYWVTACTVVPRVESMFLCSRTYCTPEEHQAGWTEIHHECEEYGTVDLPPLSIIDNITVQDEQKLRKFYYTDLSVGDYVNPEPLENEPVVISEELWVESESTTEKWEESENLREVYGWAMYGFWGIVLLVGFLNRGLTLIVSFLRRGKPYPAPSAAPRSTYQSVKLWTRRHISTPALGSYHAAQPWGWCTVPLRLQSLTLFAFLVVNVVLCCVNYHPIKGNLYWPNKEDQVWRYVPDRTGVIAVANTPLIWAFSMRNNVLIWMTGWNYNTYNQFHRWVSRIALVEAIIHSMGYTVTYFISYGGAEAYKAAYAERFFWMGVIATVAMSFVALFSIYPLRQKSYEVFLILHIFFAAVFLFSMWYHVEIFDGYYDPYIWPCVALWSVDRLLRIGRIAYLNLTACKGTATYNAESNIIRVHVPHRRRINPGPGEYCFLYLLNGWKLWENHPFTISSWTDPIAETATGTDFTTCTFTVRPHDSFTRRLRDRIQRTSDSEKPGCTTSISVRAIIEGPYGSPRPLMPFHSALLIVGGSGISVAVAHMHHLRDALANGLPAATRKLHLVWAVRDPSMFIDLFDSEIRPMCHVGTDSLATKLDIRISLYLTRAEADVKDVSRSTSPTDSTHSTSLEKAVINIKTQTAHIEHPTAWPSRLARLVEANSNLTVFYQRPDVQALILDAAQVDAVQGKRLGVVVCGPNRMTDDGRAGVVVALGKKCDGVEFLPQVFGW